MLILELFSGTKSIGKVFEKEGHQVISVDLDNYFNPTHNISILDFDYKQYKHFDYIHCSPPCNEYSVNQASFYGRKRTVNNVLIDFNEEIHKLELLKSDELVLKALEIINYFKPTFWTMENPYSNWRNSLKNRLIVKDLNYTICDYCMYETKIRCKKPTIFFNNFNLNLKQCEKKHKHIRFDRMSGKIYDRYIIPKNLCLSIYNQVINKISV
tara:strand:+ start:85 stop:720 length:636 start_codon:yes stop_codon:yes gene_type:complete